MPQVAPAMVAWYAGLTAVGKFVVMLAINMAISYVSQSLAGKKKKDAAVVRDGREVTVSGTTQPRQMVYGETVTGDCIAYYGLNTTRTQITLAAGSAEL